MSDHSPAYELLAERLVACGLDLEDIKAALKTQRIETPSWAYEIQAPASRSFRGRVQRATSLKNLKTLPLSTY